MGLLSTVFNQSEDDRLIFLTSGISDSSCNDIEEFKREQDLIEKYLEIPGDKIFVYFSTISIYLKEFLIYFLQLKKSKFSFS